MGDYDFADYREEEEQAEEQAVAKSTNWLAEHKASVASGVGVALLIFLIGVGTVSFLLFSGPSAESYDDGDGTVIVVDGMMYQSLSIDGIWQHLQSLSDIADENDGTRVVTGPGFTASVDFIVDTLNAQTDFDVRVQHFTAQTTKVNSDPILEKEAEETITYTFGLDFKIMSLSGSGDVTAPTALVSELGCDVADFADFPEGSIAIIARGDCSFLTKASNAYDSGAVAALVYNYEETPEAFSGTLDSYVEMPVFGLSYDLGQDLSNTDDEVHVVADTTLVEYEGSNVIADTQSGDVDSTIVIGSHLDSVAAGPGINDNGTGSASVLQIALEFAEKVDALNHVRFCWWGAEEEGLVGSTYYVENLAEDEAEQISANLNFDMLGSPNFIYGILNGTSADEAIRPGSSTIQHLFEEFYTINDLPYKTIPFTGRSDYGPFLESGIPAGGAETGAELVKSMEERSQFGGLAQTAYDPCYHSACDTLENVNDEALSNMAKSAAYVLQVLAEQEYLDAFLGQADVEDRKLSTDDARRYRARGSA